MSNARRSREDAEALVARILAEGFRSVAAYCAAHGLIHSTLMCRYHRCGFDLGQMLRNEKLRRVRERPAGVSIARFVLDNNLWSTPNNYCRARRSQQGINNDASRLMGVA